jgi:uncharacterized protein (TIGR03067 family)
VQLSKTCLLITALTLPLAETTAAVPPDYQPINEGGEVSPPEAELARYAGTWRVVSIAANGETNNDANRTILVENRPDGSWRLTVDGREVARGTNTLNPLAVPKEIDIEITAGDGAGTILRGIYEIEDDSRRLCFRGGNGWRPREFSATVGSDRVLVLFKRQ